jgi:hypothetical protein
MASWFNPADEVRNAYAISADPFWSSRLQHPNRVDPHRSRSER